jgi:hypothetical protein
LVASVNDGRKHHMKIARVRIRKPKEFKRIAMRSDKTDQSFAAMTTSPPPSSIPDESQ